MNKPSVFVTRIIPDEGLTAILEKSDADVWQDELPPAKTVLCERVNGAAGILSLLTDKIDAEVMDAAGSSLRVISNYAVGFDNIDIAEASRRGIAVGNTPGVLTDSTADLAFSLLMAAARRLVEADAYVREGNWKTWGPKLFLGCDIANATLGIVGFGRIGKAVARRAAGFNMNILVYDPATVDDPASKALNVRYVDLETLLKSSDFVSIHAPLLPQTHHLINQDTLSLMKPTAVLVNTARGPIVDTSALYQALSQGKIAYAALDVTDPEPIPADHPLLGLGNVIVVPHIASASIATRGKMAEMAAANLLAGLVGERLPYCVNPQIYS